jgi:hypothetical protein
MLGVTITKRALRRRIAEGAKTSPMIGTDAAA